MNDIELQCPWCNKIVQLNVKAEMYPHKSGATTLNRTSKNWVRNYQLCAFGGVTINEAALGITLWKRNRLKV